MVRKEMQEKISLIIIDDNKEVLNEFCEYFENHEVFKVVKTFDNGHDAIYAINNGLSADILLSEVIMNDIDGLDLLEKISKMNSFKNIIITSSLKNEFLLRKANELNVSYYLLKPLDFSLLEKRLLECAYDNTSNYDLDVILTKKISKLLHDLGVPSHIKGYQYIRESISLLYKDPKIKGITKELYPMVAKSYDTTSSRVERAIRHAIEVSWARGDYDLMEDLFGHSVDYDRAKPTNSEFIATITDKLKLDKEILI